MGIYVPPPAAARGHRRPGMVRHRPRRHPGPRRDRRPRCHRHPSLARRRRPQHHDHRPPASTASPVSPQATTPSASSRPPVTPSARRTRAPTTLSTVTPARPPAAPSPRPLARRGRPDLGHGHLLAAAPRCSRGSATAYGATPTATASRTPARPASAASPSPCAPPPGLLSTTTTAPTGFYHFTGLTPGNYSVCFAPPAGYLVSPQDQGTDDAVDSDATRPPAAPSSRHSPQARMTSTWDMGIYVPPPPVLAAIGDRVRLRHRPRTASRIAGETGVPGAPSPSARPPARPQHHEDRAPASTASPVSPPATTHLLRPARRLLRQPAEPGHGRRPRLRPSPAPCTITTTLSPGEDDPTWDMGIYVPPPPLLAAIGDRVGYDPDRDGIQETGENGVPGVTVTLRTPAGAIVSTTTTSPTGYYHFTGLTPGTTTSASCRPAATPSARRIRAPTMPSTATQTARPAAPSPRCSRPARMI